MEFCDNLRRLRKLRNYTQKGMAQKLGMTNQNYNRYEMQNAQPPLPVLKEIANILGVTLDELAGVNEVERLICCFVKMGVEAKRYGQTPDFLVLSGEIIHIYEAQIIVREVEKMLNPLAKVIVENQLHKEKEA